MNKGITFILLVALLVLIGVPLWEKHEPPHAHYPTMEEIEKNTMVVERFLKERSWEREER